MATAAEQLSGLGTLLNTISGSSTKTKQSQTTQTNISDAGVNELIRQILSGPGGVRQIGNAARASGLYNSTTEEKALGDVYSSAAVKAELARSPTTTSTTQTASTPGILGGSGLGTIGALIAGGTALNALSNGALGSGLGNLIGGFFGGGGGDATGTAMNAAVNAGVGDTLGALLPAGALGSIGFDLGGSALGALGTTAGAGGIPVIGNLLGGFMGGKDQALDPTNLATSAAVGAATLGPLGAVAAPLASIAGGLLGGSVICTALAELGDISEERHKQGEAYLNSLPSLMKVGYWTWGIPVAARIRAGSKFWRYFTRPIVRQYIELAVLHTYKQKVGWKDYLSNPAGSLAYFIGQPMCKIIGKIVIKTDLATIKTSLTK